jgi:membrane peptidoglycan carboxypeptidase
MQRLGVAHTVRKRRARRKESRQGQARSALGILAMVLGGAAAALILTALGSALTFIGVYNFYARDLPPPSEIVKVREQFETTLIYDRSGQTVLYQVLDPSGDRQYVPISQIAPDLINATIAIEDRSFYENPGFDLRGILRALWLALQGDVVQGGSTITQQLVKNTLIAPEERTQLSQARKIKEIILAAEISRLYSKDQILEWYLNTNFYGNLAYGVGTAARVYFGKAARDLTLGEAAMLAAIPQNPQLNPLDAPLAARQRQIVVLESMVAAGFITAEQAEQAAAQPIITQPLTERFGIVAPHFAIFARAQAERLLNAQGLDGARLVLGGGLRIYTTLDLDLYFQAECAMRAHVERIRGGDPNAAPNSGEGKACLAAQYLPVLPRLRLNTPRNVTNAASVIIRPQTGEILAMVGSLDYYNERIQGSFNVAAQGLRQPGSAFKPFVYVAAFASPEARFTPATMLLDVPTTFNQDGVPYTPRNDDGQFRGVVSVREALANSYNVPTVRTLSAVTIGQVIRIARQLGLNTLNRPLDEYGLALALGSAEVTLLDLTYAYTPFATLGVMAGTPVSAPRAGFRALDPIAILRIEDRSGRVLWQLDERSTTFGRQSVLQDALAYLITHILSDQTARLPAFGEGNALQLSRPAAAKTGTTNDVRDAWTIGYTPDLVMGVWIGNNDNAPLGDDLSGATAAAPIWHAVMEYAHRRDNLPPRGWQAPSTIVEATVCQRSGLLPTADCPKVKELFYVEGNVSTLPTQTDTYWRRYRINVRNGLRATAETPPELIAERVYFEYPPEAQLWARQTGQPLPPNEYDTARTARLSTLAGNLSAPQSLARLRGTVEVRGRLPKGKIVGYQLEYGQGISPERWFAIPLEDAAQRGEDIRLAQWDTRALDGLYTLRLSMVLDDQSLQTHTVQVTVDNQPPSVQWLAPLPNDAINANTGAVQLMLSAADNVEVAFVEFFWNGTPIARVERAPYMTEWRITKLGAQLFHAVVHDVAGNTRRSETVEVLIVE